MKSDSDGNIRYFEYQNDKFEFLSEYKSGDPQRGVAFIPKRGVNIHENEVMRAFKTVNDSYIEPISFIVPRRAEVFQDDIFPPPVGSKPAMSAREWFDGKVALPPKIDLASVYAGEEAKEVPPDSQPSSAMIPESTPPSLTSKTVDREYDKPSVSAAKGPPPSMNQQTSSIKNLAQKFNDTEEVDEDDVSSFEEVGNPSERSTVPESLAIASAPEHIDSTNPTSTLGSLNDPSPATKAKQDGLDPAAYATLDQQEEQSVSEKKPTSEQLTDESVGLESKKSEGNEVKQSLEEIRSLLEEQKRTMNAQNDTIGRLTAEVDRLRSKMDAA